MACPGTSPSRGVPWSALLGILCALFSVVSADQVFVPDFIYASQTAFITNMSNADLDAARKQEIKSALEPQLTFVFRDVTGFKAVEVVSITINESESKLLADWKLRLNRTDPKFVNATPKEIHDIVLQDLEAASKLYKDYIIIDTRKRPSPPTTDASVQDDNMLALGLGLGLGLGLPALALVILAVVLLARRKKTSRKKPLQKPALSSSAGSSSGRTAASSKLDPDPFRYGINNGGFVPSVSAKSQSGSSGGFSGGFAPSEYKHSSNQSESGSAGYIDPVIYDIISMSTQSEFSGVYTELN
ncbi:hypothetical protein BsWGS_13246 [Bradybaena similaris]